jgi:glycosyltransferase involved in cell wall biosynthesis
MARTILILTNRIPYPLHDGGALAMDAMIRGYKAAGWHVHLLAMNTTRHFVPSQQDQTLYRDLASYQSVPVDNTVGSGRIIKNLLFSSEPEHAERFRSEAYVSQLERTLKKVRPDIVQLESPFLASYIPVIRNISNARLVYRSHNIEGQIWQRLAAESTGIKRIYLNILSHRIARYEHHLWQEADVILPISEADATVIRSSGTKATIVVAPFGIRTSPNDVQLPSGPYKVYHIGAMDWLPNREAIEWFLKEVWRKVHKWAPEIEFHFAGRAMPEELTRNLPKGAYCGGEVGDAQAFLADKHILVVPLHSGSGIRVKTLEAMAAGKLVISTEIGMQGIEAQPEMHYLKATDAQMFAHLIVWASTHQEKVETITFFARKLIREHYDANIIMQNVIRGLDITQA